MSFTKPPFRVGKNNTSVVADDDTGLTLNGSTGEECVEHYGGNLIAESCSPDNAQFIVEACNFYYRVVLETREKWLAEMQPKPIPDLIVEPPPKPTKAALAVIDVFETGVKFIDNEGREVSAMGISTVHGDEVMVQFDGNNSEWYSVDRSELRLKYATTKDTESTPTLRA